MGAFLALFFKTFYLKSACSENTKRLTKDSIIQHGKEGGVGEGEEGGGERVGGGKELETAIRRKQATLCRKGAPEKGRTSSVQHEAGGAGVG